MQKLRRHGRLRITALLISVVGIFALVSGAWAALSGGTAPATFAIEVDGETLTNAKAYELSGAVGGARDAKEYTLTITLRLTDNPAPAQAFQTGKTFASAKINLVTADGSILKTYELVNATVVGYRQTGNAATNTPEQNLVLKSRTLTIS